MDRQFYLNLSYQKAIVDNLSFLLLVKKYQAYMNSKISTISKYKTCEISIYVKTMNKNMVF